MTRTGFEPVRRAARLLDPLGIPWMVAAGWALDLHLGSPTRPHEDLDLIVPREAQMEVRDALRAAGLTPWAVRGGAYVRWDAPLHPPDFQAHAHLTDGGMLDLMLADLSDGRWHYRRDPAVTLPLERARRVSALGVPYLAPEAALLFKSATRGGHPRPKDEADFRRTLPTLGGEERGWLASRLPTGPSLED